MRSAHSARFFIGLGFVSIILSGTQTFGERLTTHCTKRIIQIAILAEKKPEGIEVRAEELARDFKSLRAKVAAEFQLQEDGATPSRRGLKKPVLASNRSGNAQMSDIKGQREILSRMDQIINALQTSDARTFAMRIKGAENIKAFNDALQLTLKDKVTELEKLALERVALYGLFPLAFSVCQIIYHFGHFHLNGFSSFLPYIGISIANFVEIIRHNLRMGLDLEVDPARPEKDMLDFPNDNKGIWSMSSYSVKLNQKMVEGLKREDHDELSTGLETSQRLHTLPAPFVGYRSGSIGGEIKRIKFSILIRFSPNQRGPMENPNSISLADLSQTQKPNRCLKVYRRIDSKEPVHFQIKFLFKLLNRKKVIRSIATAPIFESSKCETSFIYSNEMSKDRGLTIVSKSSQHQILRIIFLMKPVLTLAQSFGDMV